MDLDLYSPPETLRLGLEGRNLLPQRRIFCLELVLTRESLILLLILRPSSCASPQRFF
jgi:hypothetical protein